MSRNIFAISLIFIILLIGCTTQDTTKIEGIPAKNLETYRNDIDKIQFQFPPGFKKAIDSQRSKGSEAYFTNYQEPPSVSGLPPPGGAHIGYVSLPYDSVEFERYIEGGSPQKNPYIKDYFKTETIIVGLPAIRIKSESEVLDKSGRIKKEITYLTHDEERMYQFLIEYFKGDPNDAKLEEDFEAMIKTVKILS